MTVSNAIHSILKDQRILVDKACKMPDIGTQRYMYGRRATGLPVLTTRHIPQSHLYIKNGASGPTGLRQRLPRPASTPCPARLPRPARKPTPVSRFKNDYLEFRNYTHVIQTRHD